MQACSFEFRDVITYVGRQPLFVSAYEGNLCLWVHMKATFFCECIWGNLFLWVQMKATSVSTYGGRQPLFVLHMHTKQHGLTSYTVSFCVAIFEQHDTHSHYTYVLWLTNKPAFCDLRLSLGFVIDNKTHVLWLGLARTIYIYGVYTIFLAEKSPYIRPYTVYIYGFGQSYLWLTRNSCMQTQAARVWEEGTWGCQHI